MLRHSITLVTALALSGCVAEEPELDVSTAYAFNPNLPAPGDPQSCQDFGCGKNTGEVGPRKIHELHHAKKNGVLHSEPNDGGTGVQITAAYSKDGIPLWLRVIGTNLYGVQQTWPYKVLTGGGLENARIELYDVGNDLHSTMLIAGTGSVNTWVEPIVPITTYYFTVKPEDQASFRPLCKAVDFPPVEPSMIDGGAWGANLHVAVVFSGDRYDRLTKTVTATGSATAGWFNIGCAGTALPKMVLNRLTSATSAGHESTLSERTTALRALTATYCPESGLSYTIDGEPLGYTNAPHWMNFDYSNIESLEAVWKDGAPVCLNEPRREDNGDDVKTKVEADCGLPPPCSQVPLAWWTAGYFLTVNPIVP